MLSCPSDVISVKSCFDFFTVVNSPVEVKMPSNPTHFFEDCAVVEVVCLDLFFLGLIVQNTVWVQH
jgi:hypothetical protein